MILKLLINELVPVYETDLGNKVVNGRELHEFLNIGKDFSTWMKDRLEKYGFEDGLDYSLTLTKIGERSNVTRHDYFLQMDAAKEIAMVENNEQGKKIRRYFIEVEKRFNSQVTQFALPQTMPEALRMLAAEMESKAIMAADNDRLAIETAEQKRKLKEQEAPIAIYNLAINAQNTQSMQDTAKALGTGRTRLFDILRDAGVIIKGKTTPYQRYIDAGYFVVRVRPRASGESIVDDPVTRVTAKGFDYIARLMQKRAESNETQEAE